MDKFKGAYRIPSARLQNWDYGTAAMYFITICTKNKESYFGAIEEGEMLFNELGRAALAEWQKTSAFRPDMHL